MSEDRPKICFVIPSLGVGGTERQLTYLLRGLSDNCDVRVICPRDRGALAHEVEDVSEVCALGLGSGWDPRIMGRLANEFRINRPDIVHSFMFGFDYWVNRAARKAGVPVVLSSRRQLADWKKGRHIWLQRKANREVDLIVANAEAVADFAATQEREPRESYRVIPNGIDVDAFRERARGANAADELGIAPGEKIIGMVANFSPVKDHALFVRAAEELSRRRDDVRFLLVGDGPLCAEISLQVESADLHEKFIFCFDVHEVTAYYPLMSVVVLCSKSEGFPNVVMEAMAAARPVVAADVGGIPELIQDGETGRLVQSRAPEEFADAIEKLLNDEAEATRMGDAAERYVREHLSVGNMVNAHRALYAELIQKARA